MKYRLLASDVDDTLLAHNGDLPEATQLTLQSLHNAGIVIVFSSGRATSSLQTVASKIIQLTDDEYLISYNGGRISTALSNKTIFEQTLSQSIIAEIMDHAREAHLHVQGYQKQYFIVERVFGTVRKWLDHYAKSTGMSWKYVDNLSDSLPEGSVKLLVIGEHESLLNLRHDLESISAGRFAMVFSRPHYLEIVASDVNKGHALSLLVRHLNISLEECIAFGDSSNDVEMLQMAGLGIAVANARDELKNVSDVLLKRSSDEAALVELAERFFPDILCQ